MGYNFEFNFVKIHVMPYVILETLQMCTYMQRPCMLVMHASGCSHICTWIYILTYVYVHT